MAIDPTALYENLVDDLSESFGVSIADGSAPEDRGARYAAKVLLETLLKKCITQVDPLADQRALDKFLESNRRCQDWSLQEETMMDEYLIGHFRQEIYDLFSNFIISDTQLFLNGNCGPGASVGARGKDFYTKLFDSPLTYTSPDLLRIYRNNARPDLRWSAAEKFRTDKHGDGVVVKGSKLAFVPKRNDISRVICVEPSLNMFLQKGLEVLFCDLLKSRYKIDLSTQPDLNRELARIGSVTENLCTIDLSSASDSISLRMLEEFLPRHVVSWMKLLRSPYTILPNGEEQELYMVSSMGNGFTFPLETLIFSAVVSAVYKLNGIHLKYNRTVLKKSRNGGLIKRYPGNFGVFGDDIICEKACFHQIVRLLNLIGFQVNAEKTFSEGLFRESCGADYLAGYPTRGIYVKDVRTAASRYVAINRLMEWSARHSIPLPRTISSLRKTVSWVPVPLFENPDAGIKVPLWLVHRKSYDSNLAVVYKRWIARPVSLKITSGSIKAPKKEKARSFNTEGLILSFLGGYVRSDAITIRTPNVIYLKSETVTSSWDVLSQDLETVGLARLAAVVEGNLFG